jgi:hypothetical protein
VVRDQVLPPLRMETIQNGVLVQREVVVDCPRIRDDGDLTI